MADEGEQEIETGLGDKGNTMDEGLPQAEDAKQTYKSFKYVIFYSPAVHAFVSSPYQSTAMLAERWLTRLPLGRSIVR